MVTEFLDNLRSASIESGVELEKEHAHLEPQERNRSARDTNTNRNYTIAAVLVGSAMTLSALICLYRDRASQLNLILKAYNH